MDQASLGRFSAGFVAVAIVFPLSAARAAPISESPIAATEERAAALEKANDLAGAAKALEDAVSSRKKESDFAAAAEDLARLARVQQRRGDLDASEGAWRDYLALESKNGSGTLAEATGWNGLATIAYLRGNLDEAESLFEKALAIERGAAPGSLDEAKTTGNLGLVAFEHGDYDRANDLFNQALRICTKIDPQGLYAASPLNYLGVLAKTRGDFDSAEQYYERALSIFQRLRPGGIEVAGMENNLGTLCEIRGDYDGAERHDRAALEIRRRLAPGGLDVAASLNNLAAVALDRNDLAAALPELRESLAVKEKLAPGSLLLATTLVNFAEYDLRKNDPAGALERARESLEIRRRFEPGSLDEAESYEIVARAERAAGDPNRAAADYLNALASVEAQRHRLGGDEPERAAFSTRTIGYYRKAAALLHEIGRDEEAFAVLERSRARELLGLCAGGGLRLDEGAPAGLLKERDRLDLLYDRAEQRIAQLAPVGHEAEADRLLAHLFALREQRASVEEKIWAGSPRLREIENPRTLGLADVRRSLEPGTAVLAYSVGEDGSLLFAIPSDPGAPPVVESLPAGAAELEREVGIFRSLIRKERGDASAGAAREAQGRRLYRALLAPAGRVIAGSRRLLICPDGPLHLLPFAALTVDGAGKARYFAQLRPLHFALSATLAAELAKRRERRMDAAIPLAAFGDPAAVHAPATADRRSPLSVAERASELGPLPSARAEVRALGKLFGRRAAVFIGPEATETRALATAGSARYVHFACHAVLDSRFPLDSALVLAAAGTGQPGENNGLLQAREIYEKLRLSADLVALSACDTALGRESGGEGLVGLVRAFEFAGARSVLASLWNISDRSTPALMTEFYRGVRRGLPMDESLRRSQDTMILAGGSAARPYAWAAFELQGDWK